MIPRSSGEVCPQCSQSLGRCAGLVPNTVWRWRKGAVPVPRWVDEYLRAMLALQRLHSEFVQVQRPARTKATTGPTDGTLAN